MVIGPEHEEVVRAIKGRDPAAAEEAMVTHIQNSLDRLLNVIFSSKFSS
jgi:DNA-binding GntR family transcriptional regulator